MLMTKIQKVSFFEQNIAIFLDVHCYRGYCRKISQVKKASKLKTSKQKLRYSLESGIDWNPWDFVQKVYKAIREACHIENGNNDIK